MREPAFTPGPWHYRGGIGLSVQSEFLARTICRLRPGLKTRGEIESASKGGDNFEADARLIAAAPALYEALVELLASCDRGPPAIHDGCGTTIISAPSPQAMRKAMTVLKQARGDNA